MKRLQQVGQSPAASGGEIPSIGRRARRASPFHHRDLPQGLTAMPDLSESLNGLVSRARPRVASGARRTAVVGLGYVSRATEKASSRVGTATSAPRPPEVVAGYTRGWVLFGRPAGSQRARFEWRWFPQRAVITEETAKVPKRLRSIQRRRELEVRFDQDFEAIMQRCREGRSGWLTPEAVDLYREVHQLGFTTTVATYRDDELVGGLWGIRVGRTLGIMSMFHTVDHAGALALAAVAESVGSDGRWSLVDCGQLNENFRRYGAHEVPTERFSELVWESARPQAVISSTRRPDTT